MTAAITLTMVLCFALTVSVAVSIGLSALVGIQVFNSNMLVAVKECSRRSTSFRWRRSRSSSSPAT